MQNKFQYNVFRRWYFLIIAPFFVPLIYSFLKGATQTSDILSSILYFISACLLMAVPISIANQSRTIVITSGKGLLIKKLFKTTFIPWEEISEFGRYRKLVYGGGAWCYYVKRTSLQKRIIIGLEYFNNMHAFNNIIVRKATNAILINTCFMQRPENSE